jgi:site-specific DNA recombinase
MSVLPSNDAAHHTNVIIQGANEMSKQDKISVSEKFLKDVKAVMHQHYTDAMAANIKRGMLHRAQSGYAMHRPPLGYAVTTMPGLFEINLFGTVLREELKDLASGYTTIKSVATKLSLAFDPFDSSPKPWSNTKLKRLLSDPYYAGWISYKGELYPGLHEPMITAKQHQQLLDLLHDVSVSNLVK